MCVYTEQKLFASVMDKFSVRDPYSTCMYSGRSRLTKEGFSGDPRILAMGVLTKENGAVVCETCHLKSLGSFWISDLLRLILVHTGCNYDCYSLGIYLNMDG